jgi:hypothetical protein
MIDRLNDPKYFVAEDYELGPLGEMEVSYQFQPEQVLAYTDVPLDIGIDFRVDGAQGGGAIPLRGQGPVSFPGLSANQRLRIINRDLVARTVMLFAQKGHLPLSVVGPSVAAKPSSISPQLATPYSVAGIGNSFTTTINHNGGPLVLLTLITKAAGTCSVTSLTAAGWPIPLLAQRQSGNGNIRTHAAVWARTADIPAGVVTLQGTMSSVANDSLLVYCLSMLAGVGVGNSLAGGNDTGAAFSMDLPVQAQGVWATYACAVAGGAFTEGTSAQLVFSETLAGRPHYIYRHAGTSGPLTSSFSFGASAARPSGAALELFIP